MKNKLFSILLAIVMISSACVIPIASDDGSDAAGSGTNIENGDVYGVYIDITNDSAEDLIHAVMTNTEMWGQDLTEVAGFEAEAVRILKQIRAEGAMAAFRACLA